MTDEPATTDLDVPRETFTPTPCSKGNVWCVLTDGHPGRCRKYVDGAKPAKKTASRKRTAGAGSTQTGSRSRRASSKPSLAPAVLGLAYGRLGQAIELSGPEPMAPPMGRVMQFQSVVAGQQLDALLQHVPVYKRVTALGTTGLLDSIGALVAAPLLAGLMASNERVAESMWPLLAASLQASAVEMAKQQKKQLDAMEAVSEYDEAANAILSEMFEALFAARPTPPADDYEQTDV